MKWLITGVILTGLAATWLVHADTQKGAVIPRTPSLEVATFAGGCFWCVEAEFETIPGVVQAISGYTDGSLANPTYAQVSSGVTGHLESVQVTFDPQQISFTGLLEVFWRQIDPTDPGGQFVDRGHQYSTAIFYHNVAQKMAAEQSRDRLIKSGRFGDPIVTVIKPASEFYPAEEYHQDYYKKNPIRYKFYRYNSGRDQYLETTWGGAARLDLTPYSSTRQRYRKPSDDQLHQQLTSLQYQVTQEAATEPPFNNPYWDEKRAGIYVDIVTGEPLFSSRDKFKSGTGWPSFTRPITPDAVLERTDYKLIWPRTEVRSRYGDSHLGHVFDDGPKPTGLRYCVNSAALRFIPREELVQSGYAEYLSRL